MPKPKKILKASSKSDSCPVLSCQIDWVADTLSAANDKDGKPQLPTFVMNANTGVPMRVGGFNHPLVVKLSGAKFARAKTPIIMDHKVNLRVGHTTSQKIDLESSTIPVTGVISSTTETAKEFVADAKNGFPFQASISGPIHDLTFVPEGKSVSVNGKTWKGPLHVVESMSIREISVTVLGADGATETHVAASLQDPTMNREELIAFAQKHLGLDASNYNDAQFAQLQQLKANFDALQTPPADPPLRKGPTSVAATQTGEQDLTASLQKHRENLAATIENADKFRALTARYANAFPESGLKFRDKEYKTIGEFEAAAIRLGDVTPDTFELTLMRNARADRTNQPGIISHDSNLEPAVIEAAICRGHNMPSGRNRWTANCGGDPRRLGEVPSNHQGRQYGLEAYYDANVLEKSHEAKYRDVHSISALLQLQCRAVGRPYHGLDRAEGLHAHAVECWQQVKANGMMDGYSTVRASGFSTLNIPNILQNVMHKFALAAFDAQDQTWRAICGRKNLSDFRPHNMYRLNFDGHFRKVAQDGALKHISMTDSPYNVSADTYGAMISVDRKTIRNDDLQMVVQKASGLGMLGAMRIEQSVYVILLRNPGAFFSSTLKNLISGSTSALNQTGASTPSTPAGLDQARRAFRNQVINGYPIGLSPQVLLVGTSQETQAYQLWAQETFAVAGVSGSVNWLLNKNEFQGLYRPVVTPYLNNTDLTDDDGLALSGQSDTQWYLFCNPALPQGAALVIGFLDGRDQPYFDQADTQFNIPGGIQFRSYLDWGVSPNVYQLALKSAGA